METKFWFVWCPTGRAPQCKHYTEESARTEAERLARNNPGSKFVVLEAKSVSQRVDVTTTALQEPGGYGEPPVDPFEDRW